MSPFLFAMAVAAAPPPAGEGVEDILAAWKRALLDSKSLVIEASSEEYDAFSRKSMPGARMRFRALRTADGKSHASAEWGEKNGKGTAFGEGVFVTGSDAYFVYPEQRKAYSFPARESSRLVPSNVFGVPLGDVFDPKAKNRGTAEVVRRDTHYAYVALRGWKSQASKGAVVAVPLRDTLGVPKFLPLCVWRYEAGGDRMTTNVEAWRIDGPNQLRAADFVRPEKRQGWTVEVHPDGWMFDGLRKGLFGR